MHFAVHVGDEQQRINSVNKWGQNCGRGTT